MKKYLVTVIETYEHTYLVEAESPKDAENIVVNNSDGCDVFEDYSGTEYEVREPDGEDLSMYEFVESEV